MDSAPVTTLNPSTPMAFLPPDIARYITISYYVVISGFVILLWDTLNNISVDLRLLKMGLSVPLATYIMSRYTLLGLLLGTVIMNTAPIGNCKEAARILYLYPIHTSLTALLFFFRVRAVYQNSRRVTAFFLFMWLGVIGASITEVFHTTGNLGPTDYCIGVTSPHYALAASVVPFANDTMVFIAVTWKLAGITGRRLDPLRNRGYIRTILFGDYLPNFSKAMLKEGQVYYLATVVLYFLFFVMFFIKPVPEPIRWSIGIPAMAVINIMACRVYRNTKLGVYMEPTSNRLGPADMSGSLALSSRPMTFRHDEHTITISRDIESNIKDSWPMHRQENEDNSKGTQ